MTTVRTDERLDDLCHNGLKIIQRIDKFRFSADSVLIAHFPHFCHGCRAADLGTGSGVIPLLIAEHAASVAAIENDPEFYELAARNFEMNGLDGKLRAVFGDYREIEKLFAPGGFDLVISNPPYNAKGSGKKSREAPARDEETATLADVARAAAYLLKNRGRFAMCHRADRLAEVFAALTAKRLTPKKLRLVQPAIDKPANIALIEAVKDGAPGGLSVIPTLIVYGDNGEYTRGFLEIYGLN